MNNYEGNGSTVAHTFTGSFYLLFNNKTINSFTDKCFTSF